MMVFVKKSCSSMFSDVTCISPWQHFEHVCTRTKLKMTYHRHWMVIICAKYFNFGDKSLCHFGVNMCTSYSYVLASLIGVLMVACSWTLSICKKTWLSSRWLTFDESFTYYHSFCYILLELWADKLSLSHVYFMHALIHSNVVTITMDTKSA